MNNPSRRLKQAKEFYQSIWADNGTHSEEYIIIRIANLIRDIELDVWIIYGLSVFPVFAAGLAMGIGLMILIFPTMTFFLKT